MAQAHINSDPETRSLLNDYSGEAGMPRTQFLRVLTKRYGPVLVRDLTQPASAGGGFLMRDPWRRKFEKAIEEEENK